MSKTDQGGYIREKVIVVNNVTFPVNQTSVSVSFPTGYTKQELLDRYSFILVGIYTYNPAVYLSGMYNIESDGSLKITFTRTTTTTVAYTLPVINTRWLVIDRQCF